MSDKETKEVFYPPLPQTKAIKFLIPLDFLTLSLREWVINKCHLLKGEQHEIYSSKAFVMNDFISSNIPRGHLFQKGFARPFLINKNKNFYL